MLNGDIIKCAGQKGLCKLMVLGETPVLGNKYYIHKASFTQTYICVFSAGSSGHS